MSLRDVSWKVKQIDKVFWQIPAAAGGKVSSSPWGSLSQPHGWHHPSRGEGQKVPSGRLPPRPHWEGLLHARYQPVEKDVALRGHLV